MIDAATWFAWFVLLVLFSVTVIAIVALGSLPGQIARRRNHPHADAIQVAGWLGLALGGLADCGGLGVCAVPAKSFAEKLG